MSHYQRVYGAVTFKQPQFPDTVLAAIEPLSSYFGWKKDKILANRLSVDPSDDYSVELTYAGEHLAVITEMTVSIGGEMAGDFPDVIEQVAANLRDIADAGAFELENHRTPNLADGMSTIWYGPEDDIKQEKRRAAIAESEAILKDVGLRAMALVPIDEQDVTADMRVAGQQVEEVVGDGVSVLQAAVKKLSAVVDCALNGIYAQHHYLVESGEPSYEKVYEWVDGYQVGDGRTDERLADLCWDRGLIDDVQRAHIQRGIELRQVPSKSMPDVRSLPMKHEAGAYAAAEPENTPEIE